MVASAARPISPPRASISRTICPLAVPPDGGVAGHIRHRVERNGEKGGSFAETCGGKRRLAARVARANHRDVVFLCDKCDHCCSSRDSHKNLNQRQRGENRPLYLRTKSKRNAGTHRRGTRRRHRPNAQARCCFFTQKWEKRRGFTGAADVRTERTSRCYFPTQK